MWAWPFPLPGVSNLVGIYVGMGIVFMYAVFVRRWHEGHYHTQVAQYIVLIPAYTIPGDLHHLQLTGNPIRPVGLGSDMVTAPMFSSPGWVEVVTGPGLWQVYRRRRRQHAEHVRSALSLMIGTAPACRT